MSMFRKLLRLVYLSLFLAGAAYEHAHAAMTIHICGSSSYDCVAPLDAKSSYENVGGVLITNDDGTTVHVPIGTQNNTHTPGGWSGPQSPPPTNSGTVVYSMTSPNVSGSSAGSVCTQFATAAQTPAVCAGQSLVDGAQCKYKLEQIPGQGCVGPSGPDSYYSQSIVSQVVCPAGYGLSGGSCVLENAAQVIKPSDGRCGVARSGNTYNKDAQDPDCGSTSSAASAANLSVSGGTLTVGGSTNTAVITINPLDGSARIAVATAGNGFTTDSFQIATAAPDGSTAAVTGRSETSIQGTGTLLQEAASKVQNCGSPGQQPCKIDETGTPTGTGATSAAQAALNALTPESFGISSWSGTGISIFPSLPTFAGSSTCTNPLSWNWMGQNLNPDICSIWQPLKPGLAWLLYAITALYIWRKLTNSLG